MRVIFLVFVLHTNDLRDNKVYTKTFDQQANARAEQNHWTEKEATEQHNENICQQESFANMNLAVFLILR